MGNEHKYFTTLKIGVLSLFDEEDGKKVVDVTKLLPPKRHMCIEKFIKHAEHDNLPLLQKLRKRRHKSRAKRLCWMNHQLYTATTTTSRGFVHAIFNNYFSILFER